MTYNINSHTFPSNGGLYMAMAERMLQLAICMTGLSCLVAIHPIATAATLWWTRELSASGQEEIPTNNLSHRITWDMGS